LFETILIEKNQKHYFSSVIIPSATGSPGAGQKLVVDEKRVKFYHRNNDFI